jgi:hypothetical protein
MAAETVIMVQLTIRAGHGEQLRRWYSYTGTAALACSLKQLENRNNSYCAIFSCEILHSWPTDGSNSVLLANRWFQYDISRFRGHRIQRTYGPHTAK